MRPVNYRLDLTVRCSDEERKDREAAYKIAAEWSGGGYVELKTFGFADDECLQRVYAAALKRLRRIELVEGELLGDLRVYRLSSSKHDYELERATDLEDRLRAQFQEVQGIDERG
ncbi:hypothetical protein Pan216_16520 [Planctomycetes bacterium Pan216]|uniref:Uncharacterized protein n=1 Tax=Kolteria novifilia TaxID=2527975 RepID=A0A518B1D7_9BACT|nr:hypothetical protein Pan216_16520 [Planctomycetes bacterium Pan216]